MEQAERNQVYQDNGGLNAQQLDRNAVAGSISTRCRYVVPVQGPATQGLLWSVLIQSELLDRFANITQEGAVLCCKRYRRLHGTKLLLPAAVPTVSSLNASCVRAVTVSASRKAWSQTQSGIRLPMSPADRGTRGLYGLGKGSQEWYCVQCFEKLLAIYDQRVHCMHQNMTATTVQPVLEVAYYILAEERQLVARESSCCAPPSHKPMNTPGRADFLLYFPSPDGKAVYPLREARAYRGRPIAIQSSSSYATIFYQRDSNNNH